VRGAIARLANVGFEALYGPAVPLYDWVSRVGFAGEWARWQRVALRYTTRGPTLEIGFGTGDLLPLLLAHDLAPVGLERSARMIARTRRKLRRAGIAAPPLVRGTVEALPFPAAAFGAVVATFPSGWVFAPGPLDEVARVLRPGGTVAFVIGGELAPHGPGRRLRARLYRPLYGTATGTLPPPPASALGLRWETVATAHGRAILLIGAKAAA
jgi:SAM-dependent methyltransferase